MIRLPIAHLTNQGFDSQQIMFELGIGPSDFFDAEATLPTALLYTLYRKTEQLTNDPLLGLHLTEWLDLKTVEVIRAPNEYYPVQLVLASATVGEGLERLARVFPMGFGDGRLSLLREHGGARVRHSVVGPPAPHSLCEFMVSWIIRILRHTTGQSVRPLAVRFARPAPPCVDEYERAFGCAPVFGSTENGFSLSDSDLRAPIRTADPQWLAAIELHARKVAAGAALASLLARVRYLLERMHNQPGSLSVEALAKQMGLSARTLSRRLARHGTSYRKLLDEVRSGAARNHLAAGRPVGEVASLLGFSEPGAFHRAFVRWYGRSPSALRREDN